MGLAGLVACTRALDPWKELTPDRAGSARRPHDKHGLHPEARLSKGAFYGYFGQKRDLLLALFEDDGQRLDELMDELEKQVDRSRDRLRAYAGAVLLGAKSLAGCWSGLTCGRPC
jgi:Bacterial regulatory proteins, tetR family